MKVIKLPETVRRSTHTELIKFGSSNYGLHMGVLVKVGGSI